MFQPVAVGVGAGNYSAEQQPFHGGVTHNDSPQPNMLQPNSEQRKGGNSLYRVQPGFGAGGGNHSAEQQTSHGGVTQNGSPRPNMFQPYLFGTDNSGSAHNMFFRVLLLGSHVVIAC